MRGKYIAAALVFVAAFLMGAWSNSPAFVGDGSCGVFGDGQVFVCAPSTTVGGAQMTQMWEDGSATYADGSVFDPETSRFVAPGESSVRVACWWESTPDSVPEHFCGAADQAPSNAYGWTPYLAL